MDRHEDRECHLRPRAGRGMLVDTLDTAMAVGGADLFDHQMSLSSHGRRSEEHTSELQSLMRISYAVFCLKKKNTHKTITQNTPIHNLTNTIKRELKIQL